MPCNIPVLPTFRRTICLHLQSMWWLMYHFQANTPLWSSSRGSCLQIRRSGFISWSCRIFWEVVRMGRVHSVLWVRLGSSLWEEVAAPVWRAMGIRHADHMAPSICKSWHWLRRYAAVARSVWFAGGLRPRSCSAHSTKLKTLIFWRKKKHFFHIP
jgi:hypothetical protein